MAAPRITSYWDTYGCDRCNDHDLFVLTTNNGGTKSDFSTWFVPHAKGSPTVYKGEGGAEFDTQLGNNGYALPEYLISPDRSFIRIKDHPELGSEFFTSRGIEKHVCGGSVSNKKTVTKTCNTNSNPVINSIGNGNLNIQIVKGEVYTITLYTANGRAIPLINAQYLSTGAQQVSIATSSVAAGFYCAEIKSSSNIYRQLITVK